MLRRKLLFVGFALLLLLGGCSRNFVKQCTCSYKMMAEENDSSLYIEYIGNVSVFVNWNNRSFYTDPFLSCPSPTNTLMGSVCTDTALVCRHLPDMSTTKMVLVGHAHYDHLMDLPYVAHHKLPKDAVIYSNKTAYNIMAAAKLPQQHIVVNSLAATNQKEGVWQYNTDSSMRILPIVARHLPQFMGMNMYMGTVDEPLEKLPSKAKDWKNGRNMNYLIDYFTDDGVIAHRIFFQSSADVPPSGWCSSELLQEKKVDVVLLALNYNFDSVWRTIDFMLPKLVLLIHWESLFMTRDENCKPRGQANFKSFFKALTAHKKNGRWANDVVVEIAEPGAKVWF